MQRRRARALWRPARRASRPPRAAPWRPGSCAPSWPTPGRAGTGPGGRARWSPCRCSAPRGAR
eukprot:1605022-Alexandrium_andersonii.AAC.1